MISAALPTTPIGQKICNLCLPIKRVNPDILSRVVLEQRYINVRPVEFANFPTQFNVAFEPALPLIVAPLIARGEVIGVLVADNKFTQNPITNEDAELLLAFANTAAIAINNFHLLRETEVARKQLHSFYRASSALVASEDTNPILKDIVEQACLAAEAQRVSVILLDEAGQIRDLVVTGGNRPENITDLIRSDGYSMQVMRTGKPVVIPDSSRQTRINPSVFWYGIAAGFCLPVLVEGKRIGVMWFHYSNIRHFSQHDINAAQLYVNQAATTYTRARRIAELDHMRRAADALAGVAELREILYQIVQSACEVLQADSAVIWSYDVAREQFILDESVAMGIPQEIWSEFRKTGPRPQGTVATVMELGWIGVRNVADRQQYPFLGEFTRKLLERIESQSFQGVALTIEGEHLGVLYVNYKQKRSFSEDEKEVAQAFANHAALALKKAKLLEQVSKARNTAKIVAEVATLGNLDKTLNSVVAGTKDALGCDAVTLYVYEPHKDKLLYPPTMIGVRYPERALQLPGVMSGSIVFEMLQQDQIYIVNDVSIDPFFKDKRFAKDENIIACLAIPLTTAKERVGVMFVNYRSKHRFTSNELANIELFADQAAVAIRNAQLYEQERRRVASLKALHEAGRAVTSSLNLSEILLRIAEQAWTLSGIYGEKASFSHIALKEGDNLLFKAAYPIEHLSRLQRDIGNIDLRHAKHIGIVGRAAKFGSPQLVGDVTGDPDNITYDVHMHSELAVPIKAGEQIIGVFGVEHSTYHAFDSEDVRDLEALAAQAAVAIQNAQRFEDLKKIKGYIGSKTAVDWIQIVSMAWGHSIRRDVGTALGRIALLRGSLPNTSVTKTALEELEQLEGVIRGIGEIPIIAPLSYEDTVSSVAINELVETYLKRLWKHEACKPIKLHLHLHPELDKQATVRASREWLRRVFEIVVDNAVTAMNKADSIIKQLTVITHKIENNRVEISFIDTGPGIPVEIQDKLFEEPIAKAIGSRGAGIGMMLAKTIIQTYKGEIVVKATNANGTHIVIVLPTEIE